jgi:hypothetical protein
VDQFTPQVTREDVERILQRDFPVEQWKEFREMIQLVQVRETSQPYYCALEICLEKWMELGVLLTHGGYRSTVALRGVDRRK